MIKYLKKFFYCMVDLLHLFWSYYMVIQQLCILFCAHHKCGYPLSPYNDIRIPLTVFPLLCLSFP